MVLPSLYLHRRSPRPESRTEPDPPVTDRPVVGKETIVDRPGNPDTADPASIRTGIAVTFSSSECAVHHVDRQSLVLAEDPNGGTAYVRPQVGAHIVEEPAVDNLESSPLTQMAPPSVVFRLVFGVPVDERKVLDGQPGLLWSWQWEVVQCWFGSAGIHVEDPCCAAAERLARMSATYGSAKGGRAGREGGGEGRRSLIGRVPPSAPSQN